MCTRDYDVIIIEISFDDATTQTIISNVIARSGDADASDPKTFKYPVEPEDDLPIDERPLEDAIPKDFDISQSNLSVVAMRNPHSEIFSGRANCQCGRPGDRNVPLRCPIYLKMEQFHEKRAIIDIYF